MKNDNRIIAMLLISAMSLSFTGCKKRSDDSQGHESIEITSSQIESTISETSQSETTSSTTESTTSQTIIETTEETTIETTAVATPTPAPTPAPTPTPKPKNASDKDDITGLTWQQKNSFSMLYYLAITAENIRISKDNRLVLDDIYTALLNDINPGAIDETTQNHLRSLRDIIKSYRSISIKRERLEYLHNENKANAIRSAVPNPISVLSMANSLDWKRLAIAAAITTVDSIKNYANAKSAADREYLINGWELDDEETAAIQKNREQAFDYMVDIVQEYKLDGKLTLNEASIKRFAEICKIESVQERIRRLESEEGTYKLLGNYWLELADCYFETNKYQKCLDCVAKYNNLATGIYRKDYNYVKILPKAIVAAQNTYSGNKYITVIGGFADDILSSTSVDDWSLRYFAAQVYLDLYSRTNNTTYLNKAYNIAYDNVTVMLEKQRKLNSTYLAEVQDVKVDEPDYKYMSPEQKKEAKKQYNDEVKRAKEYTKALKEARKTELPPVYEPLAVNCDLLFALAEKKNISKTEKAEIEAILQTSTNGIFLSKAVSDHYSFSQASANPDITISKKELVIPANMLSPNAKIVVIVTNSSGSTATFTDFVYSKVKRDGTTVDKFYAYLSSNTMKAYTWANGDTVKVGIICGSEYKPIVYNFKVSEHKANWIFPDSVKFEKA